MSSSDYKKIIAQQDEICGRCEKDLPKGSFCYASDDEVLCDECGDYLEAKAEALLE